MDVTHFLLAILTVLNPPHNWQADRARFPSDDIIVAWQETNSLRQQYLAECRQSLKYGLITMRPCVRDQILFEIEEELEELARISMVMTWLCGWDESLPSNDCEFRMTTAMEFMTKEEYAAGYVPFGGLPVRK